MATIGNVVISVFASTKGLSKSLENGQKRIKKFAASAIKTLKTVTIGLAASGAAAVTGIIATVNKYSIQIDKLAKTSSKLGLTIDALQKLQYQAELSGVSADTMNMALQRMVRRTSEAAKGTGAAKDALKELGLSAQYLNQLSPDQQFYAISEAMKTIGNQGDKVRLAMKIFDTEGVALVNTMNSSLEEVGAEFDKLGISVTQSGAKMVEAYQDSKSKLSAIFTGFGLKLTEQLAGPFQKLIEFINKSIIEMGGMEAAANKFARFMINAIKVSIQGVQGLIKIFLKLENVMLRLENIALLPKIAAEGIASQVAGTPGDAGVNTQKAFDNTAQIAKNNAQAANNQYVKGLDNLLKTLETEVGNKLDLSDVIKPEHYRAFDRAANDAVIRADADKNAAEKTNKLATAAAKAANAIDPGSAVSQETIETASSFSKIGGLNSGLSGFSAGGKQYGASNAIGVNSAQGAIDKNNVSLGKVNINMQTDAGQIAGDIFGEPAFLSGLKSFSDKQTNQEARAATV